MSDCNCGTTDAGRYLGTIGGQIGDRASAWGMGVLSSAKKKFKSWTGLGDYNIVANSLINVGPGKPILETRGQSIVISYRDYLGDVKVAADGGFSITKYRINPGDTTTFPWGSQIAQAYEQYKPKGVIFEFKSLLGDVANQNTVGSVIMAADYDIQDMEYSSKTEMLNSAYSGEGRQTSDHYHGLECDPAETQRNVFYIRRTEDKTKTGRDYDLCNFYIATQGGNLPADTIVGSLYVHYEFVLFKEQFRTTSLPYLICLLAYRPNWTFNDDGIAACAPQVWSQNPYGITWSQNNLNLWGFEFKPLNYVDYETYAYKFEFCVSGAGVGAGPGLQDVNYTLTNCVNAFPLAFWNTASDFQSGPWSPIDRNWLWNSQAVSLTNQIVTNKYDLYIVPDNPEVKVQVRATNNVFSEFFGFQPFVGTTVQYNVFVSIVPYKLSYNTS